MTLSPLTITLICSLSYLLGSIPFGLLLTRIMGYGDIRDIGSGNIGATNVLRTGNKFLAAATLILDGLKGAGAVWLSGYLNPYGYAWVAPTAALFAILGHMFPVWLKFRGGKGVSTTIGSMLAVNFVVGALAAAVWLLSSIISKISSLSALIMVISLPLFSLMFGTPIWPVLGIVCLVVFQHRGNITRLLAGTEPKIGQK